MDQPRTPTDTTPIHIARAGTFTSTEGAKVTFTAADLAAAAAAYDPEVDAAPIVVGHPALDDPAYGWVAGLEATADGLVARPEHVEPAFAELVRARRFRHVSASFYPPAHPANPRPGAWYLKHVGFLGAAKPAIKGLKPARFAADAAAVTIEMLAEFSAEFAAEGGAPAPETEKENAMPQGQDVNFAERQRELDERAAAIEEREAAIAAREKDEAERQAAERQAGNASFAEGLVKELKLAPAAQGLVAGLLDHLGAGAGDGGGVASFGEAGEMPPALALRKLLDGASPLIDLSERGAKPEGEASYTSFAAPAGYEADPGQAALYARARAIQAEKPDLDWMACVALAQAS